MNHVADTWQTRVTDLTMRSQALVDSFRGIRSTGAALTHLCSLLTPSLSTWRGWRSAPCRAHHALNMLTNTTEPPNVP